mmetsp:Transcript_17159/g.48232  ORF Transcript_17159/g.48232 Transcript_17159/m.48232 type:complete len:214 (-) Transcript_17159:1063-1704(-)
MPVRMRGSSPGLNSNRLTYADFSGSKRLFMSTSPLSSIRIHWNFISVTRTVLVHPSLSYLSLICAASFFGCCFCSVSAFGSLNRMRWPGPALVGHVTSTRTPPASRAKGAPGLTPFGTWTSNSCVSSSFLLLLLPLLAAGLFPDDGAAGRPLPLAVPLPCDDDPNDCSDCMEVLRLSGEVMSGGLVMSVVVGGGTMRTLMPGWAPGGQVTMSC